jgi:hypothetical protein
LRGNAIARASIKLSINRFQIRESNIGAKAKNKPNQLILKCIKNKKAAGKAAGGKPLPVLRQLLPPGRGNKINPK